MVKNFFKNWIVKNLLLTIAVVAAVIAAAIIFLNLYTRHDKELSVPDFYGMDFDEASATINAYLPKTVTMPDIVGYSMRQARAELSSIGLKTGKLIYQEDIATNNVLGQKYNGRDIDPGVKIKSGSSIDLVLGLNPSDNETFIPDLRRMNTYNAVELLQESSLNIGRIVYDNTVKTRDDSIKAVVYRQTPEPSEYPLEMGAEVIIYLTTDQNKIPLDTEEEEDTEQQTNPE